MITVSLKDLENCSIPHSWLTIFVGRKLNLLSAKEISQYAEHYLIEHEDSTNPNIAELAYGVEENEIDNLLEKSLLSIEYPVVSKIESRWNIEERKWRYCILKKILNTTEDPNAIADQIDDIYSFFNYPKDMNHLISYRPEAGFRKLINNNAIKDEIPPDYLEKLHNFLEKQKKELSVLAVDG